MCMLETSGGGRGGWSGDGAVSEGSLACAGQYRAPDSGAPGAGPARRGPAGRLPSAHCIHSGRSQDQGHSSGLPPCKAAHGDPQILPMRHRAQNPQEGHSPGISVVSGTKKVESRGTPGLWRHAGDCHLGPGFQACPPQSTQVYRGTHRTPDPASPKPPWEPSAWDTPSPRPQAPKPSRTRLRAQTRWACTPVPSPSPRPGRRRTQALAVPPARPAEDAGPHRPPWPGRRRTQAWPPALWPPLPPPSSSIHLFAELLTP